MHTTTEYNKTFCVYLSFSLLANRELILEQPLFTKTLHTLTNSYYLFKCSFLLYRWKIVSYSGNHDKFVISLYFGIFSLLSCTALFLQIKWLDKTGNYAVKCQHYVTYNFNYTVTETIGRSLQTDQCAVIRCSNVGLLLQFSL